MAEIRNLTRNGETFYPLTTSSAVINESTGEGLVIDDEPTPDSNNLVKSGGVYIANRHISGLVGIVFNGSPVIPNHTKIFDKNTVNIGDTIAFTITKASGSGTGALGFFDENGNRITYKGFPSEVAEGTSEEFEYTLPSNFSYAETIWGIIGCSVVKNIDAVNAKKLTPLFYNNVYYDINLEKIITNTINVSINDVIEFAVSENLATLLTLYELDNNNEVVKRWSCPSGVRTITIEDSNTTKIYCIFEANYKPNQYVKVNGNLVASITTGEINEKINSLLAYKEDIDESPLNVLPQFVRNEANSTLQRFLQWCGNNIVSTLGHITDVHSGGNTKYKAVGYLDSLANLFGFSLLCNNGDIGLDVGENEANEYLLIQKTKLKMSTNNLWVFCNGNHDYGSHRIPSVYINNVFNASYSRRFQNRIYSIIGGDTFGYGHTDDNVGKVRYIYLNTSEGNTSSFTMSKKQIEFVINALQNAPNDYSIVILSHLCIDAIGRWNSYPDDASADCFVALRAIFKDFVARGAGENTALSISWDFTAAQSKLACVLSGDSHFDNYIKRDGVNYIVRQGYGNVTPSEMPSGSVFTPFNYYNQCLLDVLAINTETSVGKIFRIGAGGSECDLEFTY